MIAAGTNEQNRENIGKIVAFPTSRLSDSGLRTGRIKGYISGPPLPDSDSVGTYIVEPTDDRVGCIAVAVAAENPELFVLGERFFDKDAVGTANQMQELRTHYTGPGL